MRNKKLGILLIFLLSLCSIGCFRGKSHVTSAVLKMTPVQTAYEQRVLAHTLEKKKEDQAKQKLNLGGFTLFAAGDVMYHSPQLPAALTDHGYDFTPSFVYVKDLIGDNYAIVNFESTIADDQFSGYPMFRTPPAGLAVLKWAGFDIVSLANNHSLDGKKRGVLRTLEEAKNQGLVPIGTYAEEPTHPTIFSFGGRKVALLCYTYGVNGLDGFLGEDQYMVNRLDKEKIARDVAYAKEHAQGILAMVHWGVEYQRHPNTAQKEWAKYMAELGVDIILGSHPHVIQPAEEIEVDGHKTYVIYSMGNFISNQRKEYMNQPYSEDGVMVELDICPDGDRIKVRDVRYHPTWVRKSTYKNKDHYEIIPTEKALAGIIPELTEKEMEEVRKSHSRTLEHLLGENWTTIYGGRQ